MDIFAHTLWTGVVFYKKYKNHKKDLLLSMFFGILPDLISFTPIFLYAFIGRKDFFSLIAAHSWMGEYANLSYNFTHSIFIFAAAFITVSFIRYKWKFYRGKDLIYWPMFGALLHILIDIFTHKGFYETPFLFPFSDYTFRDGIAWSHPVFMIINYSVLAAVYLTVFFFTRNRK